MLVRGWASTSELDRSRCVIAPGAFDLSIAARGPAGISLLLDHDPAFPAGRIVKLTTMAEGLWVEAILDPALPGVAKRIDLLRRDQDHGFSIGGLKRRFHRRDDGSLLVHTVDLREISLTAYPKNTDCRLIFDQPNAASLWPADFQQMLDDQAQAIAAAPRRAFTPSIRYSETSDDQSV